MVCCMCTHACVCVPMCVGVCLSGGWRSILGIIPQMPSTLLFSLVSFGVHPLTQSLLIPLHWLSRSSRKSTCLWLLSTHYKVKSPWLTFYMTSGRFQSSHHACLEADYWQPSPQIHTWIFKIFITTVEFFCTFFQIVINPPMRVLIEHPFYGL